MTPPPPSIPPVPEQVVTLAADAVHFWYTDAATDERSCLCEPEHPTARFDQDRERAVRALEAAAPAVRADERERLNRDPVAEHARQFLDSDEMTELVRADPPCSRDDAMTAIGGLIGVTRMLLKLIEGDL